MTVPTIGELFAGYGGLGLGIKGVWPDAKTIWVSDVCKVNKDGSVGHHEPHRAPCSILAKRLPDAPNLGDIAQIDWDRTKPYERRDERAAAMYAQYAAGKSLAQVAEEFGCTRQNVYDVFRWRDWALRPKREARPTVEWNGSRWSLRNNGYYARTTGARDLMHRAMWEHYHGPIPAGFDIHHVDRDRTNNAIGNLMCLTKEAHTRLHAAEAAEEVAPEEVPSVDVLTGGFP